MNEQPARGFIAHERCVIRAGFMEVNPFPVFSTCMIKESLCGYLSPIVEWGGGRIDETILTAPPALSFLPGSTPIFTCLPPTHIAPSD